MTIAASATIPNTPGTIQRLSGRVFASAVGSGTDGGGGFTTLGGGCGVAGGPGYCPRVEGSSMGLITCEDPSGADPSGNVPMMAVTVELPVSTSLKSSID